MSFYRFTPIVLLAYASVASAQTARRPTTTAGAVAASGLAGLNAELQALATRVAPSVVQVLVKSYGSARTAGAQALLATQRSSGSGVVVDAGGYIVTNAHVVLGAREIEVMLQPRPDGPGGSVLKRTSRPLPARLIGLDRETDLALIKVEATGLFALPFLDSDDLRQGQIVLAFGSPLGLDNTVTLGVVSALGRQLRPDDPMIYLQTDAPINPGNSGGPLVDVEGRLVGLNTMILSQGGGSEGLGFAAPSNIVKAVVSQLRGEGRVRRGWVGARVQSVTPSLAEGLSLPSAASVIVADVVAGTPAARADLRIGDVVHISPRGKYRRWWHSSNLKASPPPRRASHILRRCRATVARHCRTRRRESQSTKYWRIRTTQTTRWQVNADRSPSVRRRRLYRPVAGKAPSQRRQRIHSESISAR